MDARAWVYPCVRYRAWQWKARNAAGDVIGGGHLRVPSSGCSVPREAIAAAALAMAIVAESEHCTVMVWCDEDDGS